MQLILSIVLLVESVFTAILCLVALLRYEKLIGREDQVINVMALFMSGGVIGISIFLLGMSAAYTTVTVIVLVVQTVATVVVYTRLRSSLRA